MPRDLSDPPFDGRGSSFDTMSIGALLGSLPPQLLALLPLKELASLDEVLVTFGKSLSAVGGDKTAIREFMAYGVPKPFFARYKKELKAARYSNEQLLRVGAFFSANSIRVRNQVAISMVLQKIEDTYSEFIARDISSHLHTPHLPADLLEALNHATTCAVAVVSIVVFSFNVVLRGGSFASSTRLEMGLLKLRAAASGLRGSLSLIGSEIVASHPSTHRAGATTYPSGFHAIFGIAENALDLVALARSDVGPLVFAESPKVDLSEFASDCAPIAMALTRLPLAEIQPLVTSAQNEACHAAKARSAAAREQIPSSGDANNPVIKTHDKNSEWPDIEVDRIARSVRRGSKTAEFGKKEKPFSLFLSLFDHPSGLSRSQIIAILWPNRAVTDNTIDQHKGAAEVLLLPLKIEIAPKAGIWKLNLK